MASWNHPAISMGFSHETIQLLGILKMETPMSPGNAAPRWCLGSCQVLMAMGYCRNLNGSNVGCSETYQLHVRSRCPGSMLASIGSIDRNIPWKFLYQGYIYRTSQGVAVKTVVFSGVLTSIDSRKFPTNI